MLVPKPSRGPARPGSPAVLDIAVPSSCADELAVHVEARQLFLARGEVDLARGASFLAAVAALRIAASRSSGTFPHEVRVRRLRAALAAFDPAQRAHLVELMEAALEWEAAERLAAGARAVRASPSGLADRRADRGRPAPRHDRGDRLPSSSGPRRRRSVRRGGGGRGRGLRVVRGDRHRRRDHPPPETRRGSRGGVRRARAGRPLVVRPSRFDPGRPGRCPAHARHPGPDPSAPAPTGLGHAAAATGPGSPAMGW